MYTIFLGTYLCATCVFSFFALFTCFFSLLLSWYSTRALSSYLSPTTRAYFHCCPFFFPPELTIRYTRWVEVPSSYTRCTVRRSNGEFLHFSYTYTGVHHNRTVSRETRSHTICIVYDFGLTNSSLTRVAVRPVCNFWIAYEIHSIHSSVSDEIRLT